ncbi:hypothetical protein OXI21_08890 [Ignatzschineria sp. RMDPL8A]|uniref:hypothetical protein n=1 Tax=Ignatzschineria sp. RMDPL8A TaxID=2999236 RepID=UPI0016AF6288|nr:hypothetical protein [Ignatzschineria sp. RMDPL8A]MDG9730528.1 hypothetical protein [Ignatzschineria sp. RMDPL8A]NLD09996.1 hypothetical protein [Xanthomonadaceae bacterium]
MSYDRKKRILKIIGIFSALLVIAIILDAILSHRDYRDRHGAIPFSIETDEVFVPTPVQFWPIDDVDSLQLGSSALSFYRNLFTEEALSKQVLEEGETHAAFVSTELNMGIHVGTYQFKEAKTPEDFYDSVGRALFPEEFSQKTQEGGDVITADSWRLINIDRIEVCRYHPVDYYRAMVKVCILSGHDRGKEIDQIFSKIQFKSL